MTRKFWMILPLAAMVALSALMFACGDDDDDATGDDNDGGDLTAEQQAAADYMDSFVALFNGGDIEGFVDEFTEQGLRAFFEDQEMPIDELKDVAVGILEAEAPLETHEYGEIVATEDSATVTMTSSESRRVVTEQFELVKAGDTFKVDGYVDLPEQLPESGVLNVSGIDFGYEFDGGDAEAGVQAIAFTNGGEQPHQIALAKAAENSPELDTILDDFLAAGSDDLPASIDEFVTDVFAPPGQSATVVFTGELEAGRYVMFCFLPDETQGDEGPLHASLGMAAEFTIQ